MGATDQRGGTGTVGATSPADVGGQLAGVGEVPFRAIIEGMLEGVAFLDRAWRFLYVNEAGARNLGAAREDLLGKTVFEHYPGLLGSPMHARFAQCLIDGAPQRFEAPFPGADGATHWFEFSVQPSSEGVLVLSLDVSDRHETAAEDARLRAAFESIDLVALILDTAGRVTFANEALLRVAGLAREEILGTDWFDRFVPQDIREVERAAFNASVRAGEERRHHEHDLLAKDGARRTIVWSTAALRDRSGAVTSVAAVGDDVTDRRALEKAFLETSRSVTAALNASEDAIAIYRPVLDAGGRLVDAEIVFANTATGKWLPSVDVVGARGRRLFELAPDARESMRELYATVVETGRPTHVVRESKLLPNLVLDITVTPYEDGFVHVARDVTELHRTGAELREREEELRRTVGAVEAILAWAPYEGGPLTVSPQVERILGWRPEELRSFIEWNALVHPDDLEACQAQWSADGDTWDLHYRIRRADGSYASVDDRGRRFIEPTGQRSTFGVIVDASERVAADAALADSEERLRQIVEGVEAIVGFQTSDSGALELSPQIERILGWTPEQVPNFTAWRALVHPDDLPGCLVIWEGKQTDWQLEYRVRRTDGTWAWLVDRGRRVPRKDGSGSYLFGLLMDATERHDAAEALRASEEQLRRIVEGVDVIISYQEAQGGPVVISPQTERILGYPPERMARFEEWRAAIHPDDLPACQAVWDSNALAWDMEYRMRRADGAWIWVHDRGRRFAREDGRFGLFAVITEITAQHEAAARLQASEARFRAVTDSAADAILTIDTDGLIVGWNPSAERLFGRAAGDLDGQPVTSLMPEAYMAEHVEARANFRGGRRVPGHLREFEGLRADGSRFPMELSLADWTLEGKHYATAIIRDVTERHEAAAGLEQLAAFQRSVLDAMAEGMVILGADGRVTSANARAAAILGIQVADLTSLPEGLARDAKRADGSPMPSEEEPGLRTLRLGVSCRDVEMNVGRPDGSRIWLRVNTEPLRDRDGAVVAAVATFADITAEHELGEQLRRSQRLEAVGQLAGGVAHDFNNLLAAIRGYGELAMAALPLGWPARSDLEEVLRAADRAAALTRQLLLFSRRQVLAPKLVDPAEVVDGLIPMLRQLVGEHIDLVASSDGQPGLVLADPGQLEQVIVNLVVNARDAMPGGGRIEVATRCADPGSSVAREPRPEWPSRRITVTDTGAGIDAGVLPHIFEPFFTTKEAGRGSGMGLATVYGIVGASGGTVSVATAPGSGTTFTIDLPLVGPGGEGGVAGSGRGDAGFAPGDAAATDAPHGLAAAPGTEAPHVQAAQPAADRMDPRRGTALLVEDDPAVRAVLARMLDGLGWRVAEMPSGTAVARALAVGDLAEPDLLVTDVRMPGLQGPDLARRLRTAWPSLPVLFITGLADEVRAEGDEPWIHVLTKPFDAQQLGRSIEAALAGPG